MVVVINTGDHPPPFEAVPVQAVVRAVVPAEAAAGAAVPGAAGAAVLVVVRVNNVMSFLHQMMAWYHQLLGMLK